MPTMVVTPPQGGDTRRLGEAVNAIINCVAQGEAAGLVAALRAPAAGVQGVAPGHAGQYLMVLQVTTLDNPLNLFKPTKSPSKTPITSACVISETPI